MSIDKATVAHIAKLARIRLDDAQVEPAAGELSRILQWVEQLGEVDTDSVEPMTFALDRALPQREDEVADGGYQDRVLANAPQQTHGFFVVPKVVE